MMYTARWQYESFAHNGFDGFKSALTDGGQKQGVYMHVIGNAGAMLVGV
jgi:hypothetical protein